MSTDETQMGNVASLFSYPECLMAISLTPGFSPVAATTSNPSRFNGFLRQVEAAEAAEIQACPDSPG